MSVKVLMWYDLAIAAVLVLGLAALSFALRLGLQKRIIISAVRMTIQLALVGHVLKVLFENVEFHWVVLTALVMLTVAGQEAMARQKRRLKGWTGFGIGTGSMFLSSFAVIVLTLTVIIRQDPPTPWYTPQYAVPLLGMLLGNTMNAVALGMDRLTLSVCENRAAIEQRLLLGQTRSEAVADLRREAMRTGMIPMINSMAATGVVSLPGMMTGQILAGNSPLEAVMYQILIMFLISASTGFGVALALAVTSRRLFDDRHRLRLDRLASVSQ